MSARSYNEPQIAKVFADARIAADEHYAHGSPGWMAFVLGFVEQRLTSSVVAL